MSVDRKERLVINRTWAGTVVRLSVTENGITVNYSVKTYEANLADSLQTAKKGCNRLLRIAHREA